MNDKELDAIAHELKFWKGFVKTDRFIKGWVANIKTPELNQSVYAFLKSINCKSALDVGSGACSILNGTVGTLVATDPLGGLYECIFDYKAHKISPPLAISGENLKGFFNEGQFEVCHISNALDHCQSPSDVLDSMAVIASKYLIVQGFVNEAEYENHEGFHQWNIDLLDGQLSFNGEVFKTNNKIVMAEKIKLQSGKEWIIWIAKTY